MMITAGDGWLIILIRHGLPAHGLLNRCHH